MVVSKELQVSLMDSLLQMSWSSLFLSFPSCLLWRVVLWRKCPLLLFYPLVQTLRKCLGFFLLLFLNKIQVKRDFSASSSWEQQCIWKHKKEDVKKRLSFILVFCERNCALTTSQKNSYSPFMTHEVKYLLVILTTSLNECEYKLCPWMLFVYQGTYYVCTICLFQQENLLHFQCYTIAWLRWNVQYVFCNKNALYRESFTLKIF